MYITNFSTKQFTKFSSLISSDKPEDNASFFEKSGKIFGNKEIFFKLILLEEQFIGAVCSFNRLKNRSEEYRSVTDYLPVNRILSSPLIKELHIYEYFFFSCCGYIYKELKNMERVGDFEFDLTENNWSELKKLKEERRVQEHGKEWFWGEISRSNPPVPTRGDNHNFERNMILLDSIYNKIYEQFIRN